MDYRNIRKSKGWIYNTVIPFIHLEYRMLFRKIYLHNQKGVLSDKPVLIAANHPTAFIDPIFFCIFFDPPVYNMTRGDIFRKPFYRKLLEHCNMFPVYRQRDGYEKRDRNDEVFEYCQQRMLEGVAVNIFVEGEHHLDKRVLSIQKGVARIAFGTYENYPMDDLQIVPVGCNYVAGDTIRDEAKIIVGTPIFIKDYWARYQENPNATISTLCTDIRNALISICYHIEDPADDVLAEHLLTLWRNDHPGRYLPIVERRADRFFAEKELLDQLNVMPVDQKNNLRTQTDTYFKAIKAAGLQDETLVQPEQGNWAWLVFFILGFLPRLIGGIARFPVQSLAEYVAKKKVKKREFKTSVLMGIGALSTSFYLMILLITGILMGWPILISLTILLPVLSWFSIFWDERLAHWRAARAALRHPQREQLLALRSGIEVF